MGPSRLTAVQRWRDALMRRDPADFDTGLSPAGARLAWSNALSPWTDAALADIDALPGAPYRRAALITARGAFTAPLEWCAVLLLRGTEVVWKVTDGGDGVAAAAAEAARALGLPLTTSRSRAVVGEADLVVAMGSDATIDRLRATLPPATHLLGFGHRFSVAWWTQLDQADALAADLAAYDTRGCLSPAAIFTPLPLTDAGPRLAEALACAEATWPRGAPSAIEAAHARTRRTVARAVGQTWEGDGWAVWGFPLALLEPVTPRRTASLYPAARLEDALTALTPWRPWLSSIGTDVAHPPLDPLRVCALGTLQRPPLDRLHDGLRWIAHTARPDR
jgi:hypothetical protein